MFSFVIIIIMKIAYLLAIAMVFGANLRSETGVLQPDGLVSTLLQ